MSSLASAGDNDDDGHVKSACCWHDLVSNGAAPAGIADDDAGARRLLTSPVVVRPPPPSISSSQPVCTSTPLDNVNTLIAERVNRDSGPVFDTVVVFHQNNNDLKSFFCRHLLYTPHELALQYSCPVFTLCDALKMIKMTCKSQAEIFARSLQYKLRVLGTAGEDNDDDRNNMAAPTESSMMRHGGGRYSHEEPEGEDADRKLNCFLTAGTTFPPRRCTAQFRLLSEKRHSESDLTSREQNGRVTSHNLDESKLPASSATATLKDNGGRGDDSDLFFDFDIGSPAAEEEAEQQREARTEDRIEVSGTQGAAETGNSTTFGSLSSGLCSDMDSSSATVCGGAFEGMGEEGEEEEIEEETCLSLDPRDWLLHKNAVLSSSSSSATNSNSGSGSTPVNTHAFSPVAPAMSLAVATSPLISPDSLLEGTVVMADVEPQPEELEEHTVDEDQDLPLSFGEPKTDTSTQSESIGTDHVPNVDKNNEESDESKDEQNDQSRAPQLQLPASESDADPAEPFSIYTGHRRHEIAHTKLNALIALLEKDRDYSSSGGSSRTSSAEQSARSSKEHSPMKERKNGVAIPTSPVRKAAYRCPLPTIAASPATPASSSGLSKTLPNRAMTEGCVLRPHPREDDEKGDAKPAVVVPQMKRSESTPVLSSSDRALIESPKLRRRNNADAVDGGGGRRPEALSVAKTEEEMEMLCIPEPTEKLRRASSLKSGKTPPGTPSRRKIVRFADVFGLDLADVKTFLDEIPRVPKSAYSDLKEAELSDLDSDSDNSFTPHSGGGPRGGVPLRGVPRRGAAAHIPLPPAARIPSTPTTSLVPMFSMPGARPSFFDLLRDKKVCLDTAHHTSAPSGSGPALHGVIRVQNLCFHKTVSLRYSTDEWLSHKDLVADYQSGSCDGFSDKFAFKLVLDAGVGQPPMAVGQRLQFCLRYQTDGQEYWDNNDGRNYVFHCVSVQQSGTAATGGAKNSHYPEAKSKDMSAPINLPTRAGHHHHHHHNHHNNHRNNSGNTFSSNFTQSPTVMEDPWLRYL